MYIKCLARGHHWLLPYPPPLGYAAAPQAAWLALRPPAARVTTQLCLTDQLGREGVHSAAALWLLLPVPPQPALRPTALLQDGSSPLEQRA